MFYPDILYKHEKWTDAAISIKYCFEVTAAESFEGDGGYHLHVYWWNIVNPKNEFRIGPDEIFINRKDLSKYKIHRELHGQTD